MRDYEYIDLADVTSKHLSYIAVFIEDKYQLSAIETMEIMKHVIRVLYADIEDAIH